MVGRILPPQMNYFNKIYKLLINIITDKSLKCVDFNNEKPKKLFFIHTKLRRAHIRRSQEFLTLHFIYLHVTRHGILFYFIKLI